MLKTKLLPMAVILATWGVIGCPGIGPVDPPTTTTSVSQPNMYCEDIYDTGRCTDGSWPQACVAYDRSECGFKVKGKMFYCYNCDPLVCDAATAAAISYCYSGYGSPLGEDAVEEIDADVVETTRDIFLEALEDVKEATE